MKQLLPLILILLLLSGCAAEEPAQVAATTLPVYEFTSQLCQGTGITVTQLVTEQLSCLHDYSLKVSQVKAAEAAELVVISGAGLEGFLQGVIDESKTLDASAGISLLCPEAGHGHDHEGHSHEADPHIWLSPEKAKTMAANICEGLCKQYPQYAARFRENLQDLVSQLDELQAYGQEALGGLSCRDLVTFHDGFSYFAESFGLHILKAVEEESGREASARELIEIIELLEGHGIPALFTEVNGSVSAAGIIARETGCQLYSLSMAMSGNSYFDAMYRNIHTLQEALS